MPIKRLTILVALIVPIASIANPSLSGPVTKIVDGDTFELNGQMIRLAGIDAPESAQTCRDKTNKKYNCGDAATNHLKSLINTGQVECKGAGFDDYSRLIATCFAVKKNGKTNINLQMVKDGWAVAFVKFEKTYLPDENEAKRSKRGLWAGASLRPAEFRANGWSNAEQEYSEQNGCVIKGNINRKGERIYHTPWGSRHYRRTKINTGKGERWFCDEAEALAAGWRAPWR